MLTCGAGFGYNEKVAGHSHDIHATVCFSRLGVSIVFESAQMGMTDDYSPLW